MADTTVNTFVFSWKPCHPIAISFCQKTKKHNGVHHLSNSFDLHKYSLGNIEIGLDKFSLVMETLLIRNKSCKFLFANEGIININQQRYHYYYYYYYDELVRAAHHWIIELEDGSLVGGDLNDGRTSTASPCKMPTYFLGCCTSGFDGCFFHCGCHNLKFKKLQIKLRHHMIYPKVIVGS